MVPRRLDRFKQILKTIRTSRGATVYLYLGGCSRRPDGRRCRTLEMVPPKEFEQSEFLTEAQKMTETLKAEQAKKVDAPPVVPK